MAINPAPTATTARTIVQMALRDSGYLALGQTAPAGITNESFIRLNWLLALWNKKRWLTWHLVDLAFAPTVSSVFYTVGPGGNFDINLSTPTDFSGDFSTDFRQSGGQRPAKLEKAYSRLTVSLPGVPTDYPLRLIPSYEDYTKIVLKSQTNFPTHFFYDPAMPLGRVYFWPLPLANRFEMHILIRQPLTAFPNLDSQLLLPEEYAPALELTLALWLRRAAKMPPDPELNMMARDAVNTIRVNNTELQALDMPSALTRPSIYNILADEWH